MDTPSLYRIQSPAAASIQASGRRFIRKADSALSSFIAGIEHAPANFARVVLIIQQLFECLDFKRDSVDLADLPNIAAEYDVSTDDVRNLPKVIKNLEMEKAFLWLQFAWKVEDSIANRLNIKPLVHLHQLLVLSVKAFGLTLIGPLHHFVSNVGDAAQSGEIYDQARIIQKTWKLSDKWLANVKELAEAWRLPKTFYHYAHLRSQEMADSVAKDIGKHRTALALMIAGGFHSAEIARWLGEAHNIKSVIVTPQVSSLADGMMYSVRIVSEERGWSFSKALIRLLPLLILQYGPFAVSRKLITLARAQRRFSKLKIFVGHHVELSGRQEALLEALQEFTKGTVLLVETGDLSLPYFINDDVRSISADQFTYYAESLDMPGETWRWPRHNYVDSQHAAVCCLRSYIPIRNLSVDEVVWVPKFLAIRELDRDRAAGEMLRVLRPRGILHVWLRPGAKDNSMADSITAAGGSIIGRSQRWLRAQKKAAEQIRILPAEPISRILFMPRNPEKKPNLGDQIVSCLKRYRVSTFCHRSILTGLHEDLVDSGLGLDKPALEESRGLLQSSIEGATLSATLTVLVVNRALLDLVGGDVGLRRVLVAVSQWASRLFVLVEGGEADNDSTLLESGTYFCSDIAKSLETEGEAISEAVKVRVRALRDPGFTPVLPKMLLSYLGCPECPERNSLSVQKDYIPPRNSEGVLLCRKCKTAYHMRNGIPETIALAEMRDMD
jgi:uncharacterized protein YbaR (Trm112 family)